MDNCDLRIIQGYDEKINQMKMLFESQKNPTVFYTTNGVSQIQIPVKNNQ